MLDKRQKSEVIATSCSGSGEILTQTNFAKAFAEQWSQNSSQGLDTWIERSFLFNPDIYLERSKRHVGVIGIRKTEDEMCELVIAHSTPYFSVGFRVASDDPDEGMTVRALNSNSNYVYISTSLHKVPKSL
ncbi:hypothetical protein ACOME3_001248 [Neoechinorhynchus agilis]